MRNDRKFRDRSALYVTCFKNNVFLTTNQILCFPCIKRQSHSTRQKLFSFHITKKYCSLCRENLSIACSSRSGHLGVKRLIFAPLAGILRLTERIVAWSRHQRRTMNSLS